MPKASKSKKKTVRTLSECRGDKWSLDYPRVVSYRQRMGISVHTLPEGRNFDDHTDYIRQLLRDPDYGLNIQSLDDRIEGLEGWSSKYHQALLTSLQAWQSKHMGNSGVTPRYVAKAFIEPKTQLKISAHWAPLSPCCVYLEVTSQLDVLLLPLCLSLDCDCGFLVVNCFKCTSTFLSLLMGSPTGCHNKLVMGSYSGDAAVTGNRLTAVVLNCSRCVM